MATALVTGANRGIGLELVRQLVDRGDDVIAVCRTPSAELEATGCRIEAGIDVGRDDDVATLSERIGDAKLDLLVNNAGILRGESLDAPDFDSIRQQLEVNALGPLRVTAALKSHLGKGAKVGIVTSRMGSITDNTSGGMYGYRMSKAAVNMAGVSLAHDLRPAGVSVALLHPGFVKTGMTGGNGHVTPDVAAKGLLDRLDALTLETSGGFWHAQGDKLPW